MRENDSELIKRAKEGDSKAYDGLLKKYKNSVYNLVYRMVRDVQEAEDLTQEAFIKAFNSLTSFNEPEFEYACYLAQQLSKKIFEYGLPDGTLLNVNVPPVKPDEIEDIVITRQGKGRYEEFFDKRIDPNNRTYYWMTGKRMNLDHENDVDDVVIRHNKVSITPIRYDLTDTEMLHKLSRWNIEK